MRYRLALCGFSEFEYRAMHFSFQHPAEGEIGYDVVDAIGEADLALVDGDSKPAVKGVVLSGRVAKAVFVGGIAPPGAGAAVPRPIDPAKILRALADLAQRHATPPPATPLEPRFDPIEPEVPADAEDSVDITEFGPSEPPVLTDSIPPWGESQWTESAFSDPAPRPAAEAEPRAEPFTEPFSFARPAAKPLPAPIPPPPPLPPPPPAPAAAPKPELSPEALAQQEAKAKARAAARAAARRARQSSAPQTDPGQLDHLRDVLVLDADEQASAHLTGLLELFGFRVHAVSNMAHAADVLSRSPLVAAFLDIRLDGNDEGDGIALLQTINDLPRLVGHPTPAVLTVSVALNPADRVRAALAGIKPLIKPVTRGDVARALEACDIVLPSDARRV